MKSWGSFFWGFVFGAGSVHSAGCADPHVERLFGDQCHYPEGVAVFEVSDPAGVYPTLYGLRDLERAVVAGCQQSASFDGGSQLELSCEDGDPVEFCSVSGICVDPSSDDLFQCEGSVRFE